jgi:hypothetical protein
MIFFTKTTNRIKLFYLEIGRYDYTGKSQQKSKESHL